MDREKFFSILITVVLLVLALGVGVSVYTVSKRERLRPLIPRPSAPEIVEAEKRRAAGEQSEQELKVAFLLEKANSHFQTESYISPAGDNAFTTLKEILNVDPDNRKARSMIEQMREKFENEGDSSFTGGDYVKARQFYEKILFISPGDRLAEARIALIDNLMTEEEKERAARLRARELKKREEEINRKESELEARLKAMELVEKGMRYERYERYDQALAFYREAKKTYTGIMDIDALITMAEQRKEVEKEKREKEVDIERVDQEKEVPAGMVFVKGGCFQMGCGSWTSDCEDDEKPVHEVCVRDFYIDKFEVSQMDYTEVMNENPSDFRGDELPVERVTWQKAREYCEKIEKRLPTEAEWEYAARSGGKGEKYAGTSYDTRYREYAWYWDNSGDSTHPVGQKRPNGLDIYDMSGNVWEWVSDWYDGDYYKNKVRQDPKGPEDGTSRVLRGGSWVEDPWSLRTSNRYRIMPEELCNIVGFRCAKSL